MSSGERGSLQRICFGSCGTHKLVVHALSARGQQAGAGGGHEHQEQDRHQALRMVAMRQLMDAGHHRDQAVIPAHEVEA